MPTKDFDHTTILVDFPEIEELPDSRRTRRLPDDLAQLSAEAISKAMSTIREMAERAIATIDDLANHPSQVELEFVLLHRRRFPPHWMRQWVPPTD
jgi:hypothetical protein